MKTLYRLDTNSDKWTFIAQYQYKIIIIIIIIIIITHITIFLYNYFTV